MSSWETMEEFKNNLWSTESAQRREDRRREEEMFTATLSPSAKTEYTTFKNEAWKSGRYLEHWSIITSIGEIKYNGQTLEIDGYQKNMNAKEAIQALELIRKLERYVIPGGFGTFMAELNKSNNAQAFFVEWWKLMYRGLLKNITIYSGVNNILSEEQLQIMAWRMNARYRTAYDIKLAENTEKQNAESTLDNLA